MRNQRFITTLLTVCCFGAAPLQAQDTHVWNDAAGGVWSTFSRWTPIGVPAPTDTARFNLNLDYTVSLIDSAQTRLLQVLAGDVTFASSGIFPDDRTLALEDALITAGSSLLITTGNSNRRMTLSTSDDLAVRGWLGAELGSELISASAVVDSADSNRTAQVIVSGVSDEALGTRSQWTATRLDVGTTDNGKVRIEEGALAQINGPVTLGNSQGSNGEILVTGRDPGAAASDFRSTGTITIGELGSGTFRVEEGAFAATGGAILGNAAGGRGSVTIENNNNGNGSFWIAGILSVKRGDVVVNRGGSLRTFGATIGSDDSSSITLSGAGTGSGVGLWEAQNMTTISASADATLDILQGGLFNGVDTNVGPLAAGVGRINVSSSNPAIESRFLQTGDLHLGGDSSGPGGVGHLNLNTNSFARILGTTKIYANSSVVMGPGSQLLAPTIDNSQGGFFDFLRGTLHTRSYTGDLTNQEGTLAPYRSNSLFGEGAGITFIDGNYTQQAGATLAIDLVDDSACGIGYDHLEVSGNGILGGSLELTLAEGFWPKELATFNIVSASNLSGVFDNVAPGERLTTTDGFGSFLVNYGDFSPFSPNSVILSDFLTLGEPDIPGDLNLDGIVDGLDLGLLLGNFGSNAAPEGGELNGTDPVDGLDLGLMLGNWNLQALAGLTSVPEPASGTLGTFGLALLAATRRRRPTKQS